MSEYQKHYAIECSNLSIGYKNKKEEFKVQTNINFRLSSGVFGIVLGQNGIGKSTLLRTIAKVQDKLEGKVFIQDKPLESFNPQSLSKTVSLVLTERLPNSQLTVFELVALGRQPYTNWLDKLSSKDEAKVLDALEMTETFQLKNKRFYELSDGQLQRVLIARALAQDTPIIILDEPTAHLDIHHTIKIFSLLKDLVKKTKKTILISSHEVNLGIQLADSLLLMAKDQFIAGSLVDLIEKDAFKNLFPSELIRFNPELKQFIIETKN